MSEKNKKKIVVCTPAGRKSTLSILLPHILAQKEIIDEYHLWLNTDNEEDLAYLHSLQKAHPDFIKCVDLPISEDGIPHKGDPRYPSQRIGGFFTACQDPDTVYLRLDDDVIWLEPDFVEKMVNFTSQNNQYGFCFGNIVNNALCDHITQRLGAHYHDHLIGYDCMDNLGWADGACALRKHHQFLSTLANEDIDGIDKYKYTKWILYYMERCSINAIAWLGKNMTQLIADAIVYDLMGEEFAITSVVPNFSGKLNCINGQALCVHYSFFPTKQYLDASNILNKYQELSNKIAAKYNFEII